MHFVPGDLLLHDRGDEPIALFTTRTFASYFSVSKVEHHEVCLVLDVVPFKVLVLAPDGMSVGWNWQANFKKVSE